MILLGLRMLRDKICLYLSLEVLYLPQLLWNELRIWVHWLFYSKLLSVGNFYLFIVLIKEFCSSHVLGAQCYRTKQYMWKYVYSKRQNLFQQWMQTHIKMKTAVYWQLCIRAYACMYVQKHETNRVSNCYGFEYLISGTGAALEGLHIKVLLCQFYLKIFFPIDDKAVSKYSILLRG